MNYLLMTYDISSRSSMLLLKKWQLYSQNLSEQIYGYESNWKIFLLFSTYTYKSKEFR